MRGLAWLGAVVLAIGCGDDGGSTDAEGSTGSSSASTTLMRPDVPEPSSNTPCDPTIPNDCPEGFKCAGAEVEDRVVEPVCIPLPDDPLPPGAECPLPRPVVGDGSSDACDERSVCVWIGGDPDFGTCRALCPGGDDSLCPPEESCMVFSTGAAGCAPSCDPLSNACPEGTGCYTFDLERFACMPTHDLAGGHGSPCFFQQDCMAGTACYTGARVGAPGCETQDCCTPYCDLDAPNTCPGAELGEECVSPWPVGAAPPPFANAGGCAIPQ